MCTKKYNIDYRDEKEKRPSKDGPNLLCICTAINSEKPPGLASSVAECSLHKIVSSGDPSSIPADAKSFSHGIK